MDDFLFTAIAWKTWVYSGICTATFTTPAALRHIFLCLFRERVHSSNHLLWHDNIIDFNFQTFWLSSASRPSSSWASNPAASPASCCYQQLSTHFPSSQLLPRLRRAIHFASIQPSYIFDCLYIWLPDIAGIRFNHIITISQRSGRWDKKRSEGCGC